MPRGRPKPPTYPSAVKDARVIVSLIDARRASFSRKPVGVLGADSFHQELGLEHVELEARVILENLFEVSEDAKINTISGWSSRAPVLCFPQSLSVCQFPGFPSVSKVSLGSR